MANTMKTTLLLAAMTGLMLLVGEALGGRAGMTMALAFAALLIQLAVSRSREYEADAWGARLVGHPEVLAGALRKLQTAAERIPMRSATPATAHLFIVNPLAGHSHVAGA